MNYIFHYLLLLGLDKKEARKVLKDFKVEYSGSGDTVIYMSPSANQYIKRDGTVKLLLSN